MSAGPEIVVYGRSLEPYADRRGLRHARVVRLDGDLGSRVCELHKAQARGYVNPRSWTFPVTCLWCIARLVRM